MKMNDLVSKLNEASEAYYNGKEIMTNKEFDALAEELRQLEEIEGHVLSNSPLHNVGSPVSEGLPKFKHTFRALSLDKTKDADEFVNKFRKGIEESGSSNDRVVLMYKEDGSTIQAYYKFGKLDKLVTRGNGEIGSVVTHNIDCFLGLPTELPVDIDLVVRGEAVMSYAEFNLLNSRLPADEQYANPRNLASATLTMLDPKESAKRRLVFQAFNLVDASEFKELSGILHCNACNTRFSERLHYLSCLGFNVVPYLVVSIDQLQFSMEQFTNQVVDYEYPVDGLVAALDNYEYASKLQGTEHHPHVMNGYAFKWKDEAKETVLREIEWSPSRTGLLNPVAIFDPIELEGTIVKRASLHNLSVMRKMRIHLGDTLSIFKSNMIIPYIDENLSFDSEEDYTEEFIRCLIGCCPTCGATGEVRTSKEGIESVYCPNTECPEKMIGKLAHFCERDCMDIQGMSEETIQKLVEAGFIKEYADFFLLDQKPGISFLHGFGKQSWRKMCEASNNARRCDFVHFLTALGIPNVGKGQSKTLLKYINEHYDELTSLVNCSNSNYEPFKLLVYLANISFDFAAVPGFGISINESLHSWFNDNLTVANLEDASTSVSRVMKLLEFTDIRPTSNQVESQIAGKSFCITGKLTQFGNRQELVAKIESLRGRWIDSVSKKTDFLINNDVTSSSGKNKKAKELNIPIISEEDFLEMIQ
jgi:DNA ligase (NAD+)